MEDSLPPANDAKLNDRLQDYNEPEYKEQETERGHLEFDSQVGVLKEWSEQFGLVQPGVEGMSQ